MAGQSLRTRADRFWLRITEGMQLNQLWQQFRADARSSYRLYSQGMEVRRAPGERRSRHVLQVGQQFFWAVIEKLTPARRVLLLVALILLFSNVGGAWQTGNGEVRGFWFGGSFWGGLLLLLLLLMEVGDRVVMKRDLQIAKEIQAWLLPAEPPEVPGLEIAFATRPANTVAGDYYDVFPQPGSGEGDRKFLLAVADVAGKSVPAAMLMATFQASLKTLSGTPGPLTELAARINRYACTNSQNGRRFTTAFVAEYDPAQRQLVYVNAGHNSPILLRRSGSVERLDCGGMPLGILESAVYEAGTVTLEPGDWLAAFTDGVIEAEDNQQRQFGEDRFLFLLRWGINLTPTALLQAILTDINRFVGHAPQHDDITCMLVKSREQETGNRQ